MGKVSKKLCITCGVLRGKCMKLCMEIAPYKAVIDSRSKCVELLNHYGWLDMVALSS